MTNVTEAQLRQYIETFHRTYIETADHFLLEDKARLLFRYPLISGGTIGYVSTNFGVGIEYVEATEPSITIQRSSARIEDLFTGAPPSVRKLHPLFNIEAGNISIIGLTLKDGFPLRLTSTHASVRLVDVLFEASGWRRAVLFVELYGNRSPSFWSEINAISRAKDEILLALLDLKQAQKRELGLEEYLKQFKKKTVLVLGDYSAQGRPRLQAIKDALTSLGYDPILLDDVPDDFHYDLQQKAVAVGSVARFIVIDDSSKSGHLLEFAHVQSNRWVVILMRLEGSEGSYMTHGTSVTSRVILEQSYSQSNFSHVLEQSVQWAENQIGDIKQSLADIYPWRQGKKDS